MNYVYFKAIAEIKEFAANANLRPRLFCLGFVIYILKVFHSKIAEALNCRYIWMKFQIWKIEAARGIDFQIKMQVG